MIKNSTPDDPQMPKARPTSPAELREALESGTLDGRTKAVRVIRETKAALAQDFAGASRAVLIHTVAVNLAIQRAIEDHALANPDKLITKGGKLAPLLSGDLAKIQASTRAALTELRQLEGRGKGPGQDEPSAADMILELDRDGGE